MSEIALLLRMLDESYEKSAWQGPNLRGALRGVRAQAAAWRPAPGRHNIWEIVVHAAYWKYAVWRLLTGEKRGRVSGEGEQLVRAPRRRRPSAPGKPTSRPLDLQHRQLRRAVENLSAADLGQEAAGQQAQDRHARLRRGLARRVPHGPDPAAQAPVERPQALAIAFRGCRGSSISPTRSSTG